MPEELTKYKVTISFTYVDEDKPENEQPGTCDVKEELFKKFFTLAFKDCELVSYEKNNKYYDVIFTTKIKYMFLMMNLQNFRFKISGKMCKIADVGIIVVK